jgi:type III pantothenate kinase
MYPDKTLEATLVVDIGNTNITCGIYQNGVLGRFFRFHSSSNRTADEYYSLMVNLKGGPGEDRIGRIAIGSVVPELTRIWQHLFAKYFGREAVLIDGHSDLGLGYRVPDPGFIGADLVANAYGAWKKYSRNCIVVDLGTATTVQMVTSEGEFLGTAIAPGLKTGAAQLFEKAALLSEIELASPETLLGTNTRDALLSGIVQGHAFMLESFIKRIKLQYFDHKDIFTVLTGGIADLVKPLVPSIDHVDKTLTLDGLFLAQQRLAAAN